MRKLKSYLAGEWVYGQGPDRLLKHAVDGTTIAGCNSDELDFKAMVEFARSQGGARLREMNFQERGALLKKMVGVLNEHRDEFYEIAASYGATKKDAAMDIDGGVGTLAFYAGLGVTKLPAARVLKDGEVARLSKEGNFCGQHLYVPREGVAVQINAYNFPSWGMLEKLAPAFLAGMPSIVKPATPTAWLAHRMVEVLLESGLVPEGALQLICGSVGDLFDHLNCQDVVSFTGSAATGREIRSHQRLLERGVKVNVEADSLNSIILGPGLESGSVTFQKFIKEIRSEMTGKAGQKCTAIRRILVPQEDTEKVIEAIRQGLSKVKVGNPAEEGVWMGPLVSRQAREAALDGVKQLAEEAQLVMGSPEGGSGAFLEPLLFHCQDPVAAEAVHRVEVFGPVATVMPYQDVAGAIELANRGGGSLVASIFSDEDTFATRAALGLAPFHGRVMVINERSASESTGHGVVMPHLTHGGPGRAGGGEELGGLRSLYHYMHRVAFQGDPERLEALYQEEAAAVGS